MAQRHKKGKLSTTILIVISRQISCVNSCWWFLVRFQRDLNVYVWAHAKCRTNFILTRMHSVVAAEQDFKVVAKITSTFLSGQEQKATSPGFQSLELWICSDVYEHEVSRWKRCKKCWKCLVEPICVPVKLVSNNHFILDSHSS